MPPATAVKSDTYAVKVAKAITELKSRTGSSLPAITTYIQTHYGTVNKTALSQALKKGVTDGSLKKVKASYKVTPKAKPAAKPKKEAPKKKLAAKPKTATKKKTTVKKAAASTAKPKKAITKKKTSTATKKAAPKKKVVKKKTAKK